MIVEQRKHIRLLPGENTFAVIGQKFSKIGKVKDISQRGLSIEYIVGEDRNHKYKPTKLDIFKTEHAFYIYNVPCELIYDEEINIPRVNNKYAKILTINRCGVKFGELDEDHRVQLKLFFESYTTELA